MECKEFFENNRDNREKCKLLQSMPEVALAWEAFCSASDLSSGRVGDNEMLYRQIYQPIHFDTETRKLKPTAFDDVANKGLSVNRALLESRQAVEKKARAKAERDRLRRPDRFFYGLASIVCKDMRCILSSTTQKQAFCIFDTALQDDLSHADVCQIISGKQEARSVRSKLYEAFNKADLKSCT
jgi:hypothetical protein